MAFDKQQIFQEIKKCYTAIFGDALESVYIYGSATTDDFQEKYSDINVALILKDISIKNLIKARDCIKLLRKKHVTAPLFLTKEHIIDSLDSFPIEFLNIKTSNLLLAGEDFFEGITFTDRDIRLQAERELKGKLLLLRAALLENLDKKKILSTVVINSFTALMPVLKGIVFIMKSDIPKNTSDIIRKSEEVCGCDLSSFQTALKIKNRALKFNFEDFISFFENYITAVGQLANYVDKL
ncbi:MAG TPA: hypothetical protein ENG70_05260 [Candidatus Cloacimonetes bacterium]|nr:hypothetical protein [Candidatus Cloacimonadota bacterium]HEX38247.1 hypothetical protein [Candidatus Cloacimonadota bacterium]